MTERDEATFDDLVKRISDEIATRPAAAAHIIGATLFDVIQKAELAALAERVRIFAIVREGIRLPFDGERVAEIQENPIDFLNQVIATLHIAFETNLNAIDAARALSARAAANPSGVLS